MNMSKILSIVPLAEIIGLILSSRLLNIKSGLGFVQMNVRIQWNPVYKAFYRIRLCRNERSGS